MIDKDNNIIEITKNFILSIYLSHFDRKYVKLTQKNKAIFIEI